MSEIPVPEYYKEWAGKRVEWLHGDQRGKQGTVTTVIRRQVNGHWRTLVSVSRDDGFLSPWVDTDLLTKIHDGNHEEVSGD